MNYTFLPEIERGRLKREYRVRALVVFLFVLSAANMFGIVSLFPTYINSRVLETAELDKISQLSKKNVQNGIDTVKKELIRDNLYINSAEQFSATSSVYSAIRNIVSAKGNLKLNSIAVNSISSSTISFSIQGFSPTRDLLLAFKNRLETSIAGSVADLPISALAKNKDIQFSINFTSNI